MLLMHGSNKIFKQFEISEGLIQHNKQNLVEGIGIYMTKNKKVASSYGQYVYVIKVDDEYIIDFTDKSVIYRFVETLSDKINVELPKYMDIEYWIEGILEGEISIMQGFEEIKNNLLSNDYFMLKKGHRVTYKNNCIFKELEDEYKKLLKSIVKYYDKSLGEVYICRKNANILNIEYVI
ncbi:hypothetical protein [Clostridium perfringens]|uniref:Uncharacterized protein n=1 Tax=Clostridium perfringens TaxID=1502 RepID=A0A140GRE2_CLOPF|nr:hypothetical protein [Clostridium perfringens]AMN31101.1 hypothetical protein JFP838_pA0185 [Clostridium perfringens]